MLLGETRRVASIAQWRRSVHLGVSATLSAMQSGSGPRPFDISTGFLIELDAPAWLTWLGLPLTGPVRSIESDVATVLAEVDKVLRVDGPVPWLAHVELQTSYDPKLPMRMLQYHALLLNRHELPVQTTVILLRRQADGPEMSGLYEQLGPLGTRTVTFDYRVVRLWERPVEELLRGGIGLLPLAPLAAVSIEELPALLQTLNIRFTREADAGTAEDLRSVTSLLLGLRYDREQIRELVRRMSWIKESSVYQVALEEGLARGHSVGLSEGRSVGLTEGRAEGRAVEARRLLLSLGMSRLGAPSDETRRTVDGISDIEELERLLAGLFTATAWQELLAPPSES